MVLHERKLQTLHHLVVQALAEAEAGLLSGRSEGALDPPARRDSAADLHVQGRQLSSPQGAGLCPAV